MSRVATTLRADAHPSEGTDVLKPLELALQIVRLAEEKVAEEILGLDLREACSFTDYFVICSGRNARQAQAIAGEVREALKRHEGLLPRSAAGEREGSWILLDYLDVVFHVFTPEARAFYALEELWHDAPRLELRRASGAVSPGASMEGPASEPAA